MHNWTVSYSLPHPTNESVVIVSQFDFATEGHSPYSVIDYLADEGRDLLQWEEVPVVNPIPLKSIIPIHNRTGLRELEQIISMIKTIKDGKHILHNNNLPNMKLIIAPNGRFVLFDGHHTALSNMFCDKKWLHQVPYLLVSREGQAVTALEISHFFPEDGREKVIHDWFEHTVNWQAPEGEQIEIRSERTLGDLFRKIKPELKRIYELKS